MVTGHAPDVFYNEGLNLLVSIDDATGEMRGTSFTRSKIDSNGSFTRCEKSRILSSKEQAIVVDLFDSNDGGNRQVSGLDALSIQLTKESGDEVTYFVGQDDQMGTSLISYDEVQDSLEVVRESILVDTAEVCVSNSVGIDFPIGLFN